MCSTCFSAFDIVVTWQLKGSFPLRMCVKLTVGMGLFERRPREATDERAFTLTSSRGRMLHVLAASKEIRDDWCSVIRRVAMLVPTHRHTLT